MSTATRPIISRLGAAEALRRSLAPNRFVLTLLVIGMIAATVQVISYQTTLETQVQVKANDLYGYKVIKPTVYYVSYALQIVLSLFAGLAAMVSINFRNVERTYPMRLCFLLGAALLMTARSYTVADLRSLKLIDWTGPVPFFFFVLVFIGVNRKNWPVIDKAIVIESVVFSVLVLTGITKLRMFSREEAVLFLGGYLNLLLWPAAWVALRDYGPNSWWRYLRFGPTLVYAFGSVFVQTRLNFVMLLTLLSVYAYVQRKRGVPQLATWTIAGLVLLWSGLFTAIFLENSKAYRKFDIVANAFYSRLDEDTRTGQLYSFFRDVQPHELLLGRGSFAIWNWNGVLWTGGTDLGYLTLLLFGGLPLFASFILAGIVPGLKLFRNDIAGWQLPAAGVIAVFGVQMFSSSYPGATLQNYILVLCTGACISRPSLSDSPPSVRVRQVG